MDSTNLCNALRMEFEGVFENKIPLNAFPVKIQDMISHGSYRPVQDLDS